MSIFNDSHFTVGVAFFLFLGLLAYFGVHKLLGGMLDARADRIRGDLDEARRLREEAQATFAEFERRSREVQGQADEIVTHARAEAEKAAEIAMADLKHSIERRLKAADEQIGMAEANAVREVKDKAVQVAIAAAAEVMAARMTTEKANALIDDSIKRVGARLN